MKDFVISHSFHGITRRHGTCQMTMRLLGLLFFPAHDVELIISHSFLLWRHVAFLLVTFGNVHAAGD